jgi:alanine dehydrogenase
VADGIWLRFVGGPEIDALGLTRREIVDAVEAAVREHGEGRTAFEPRVHLTPDNGGIGHFNVLRGHLDRLGERGVSGVKVVGDFVPNYQQGLPSELAMATLFDPTTGVPLAVLDATMITAARTGAMTTVGARWLARRDSKVLAHVGARGTAWWNVTMLDDEFDLDEIRVTSRRPESREKFAAELSEELSTPVRVCATAEEAFDGADILVEATRLMEPEPLLRTSAVKPGTLSIPYGTVSAVELDLLDVMDKVVVDDWREAQSGRFGSLRRHVDTGRLSPSSLYAEIGEIVAGRKAGRETAAERTLFWHRGLSLLDVAIAHLILTRAEAADVGTMLRFH